MRTIKRFQEFLYEELDPSGYPVFMPDGDDNIVLFRGQAHHFYNPNEPGGYFQHYGMLFVTNDINNAHFYTKTPGTVNLREIMVFSVPNRIQRVTGMFIDRATRLINTAKAQGYIGITSNLGELYQDRGEVGLFYNPTPIRRWQTTTGVFSPDDVSEMMKWGLNRQQAKAEERAWNQSHGENASTERI